MEYNHTFKTDDPISIDRDEFDAADDQLAAQNIPLKPDRELAWRNLASRRVNCDAAVVALIAITMATYTP